MCIRDSVAGSGKRHFFAGIAGWSHALRLAGVPDDASVWTGSCPCQPLSSAGRQRGFDDPRHLWPVWFRLIRECHPAVIFGEQVASALGWTWLDLVFADLEGEGYACAAADLPACSVGAPHRRQRLFFVAYADGQQRRLRAAQRQPGRADAEAERRGKAGRLADAERTGLEVIGEQQARGQLSSAERGSSPVGLANAACERWNGMPRDARSRREQPEPARSSETSGMADPQEERRGTRRFDSAHGRQEIKPERHGDDYWHPIDWIPCSDGVSRPVEPGTRPLVTGLPGRVGLLRGYGNAISPPIAAAFIRAALESSP